ncbi:pyridoxal-phosphate dependent enzyme [Ruania suaedae]|nr:pyridoxal-phosphate dependent enzyme [Ruania suaedae]
MIHGKLDSLQLSGSIKERTAVALLAGLVRDGHLSPGGTVVESTSGNLGVALARLCAISGFVFVAVVDERANVAACRAMQAYGATLERVPTPPDGNRLAARLRRVRELLDAIPGAVTTDQYGNADSPAVHAASTYPEIVADLGRPPTHLYAATSTSGTLLGLQQAIAADGHDVELVAVDAEGSALFGGTPAERQLPGLGAGVETALSGSARPDVLHRIPESDMVLGCRLLARREGILAGASTGAIVAALGRDLARLSDDARVAVIVHDSGVPYLPTVYDDEWVADTFGTGPLEALAAGAPNPFGSSAA